MRSDGQASHYEEVAGQATVKFICKLFTVRSDGVIGNTLTMRKLLGKPL